MRDLTITIIFIGMITHADIMGSHHALLVDMPGHIQLLVAPTAEVQRTKVPLAPKKVKASLIADPALTKELAFIDITNRRFTIANEIDPGVGPDVSFTDYIPKLETISGKTMRLELLQGKSHPSVGARLITKSRLLSTEWRFPDKYYFNSTADAQCVPKCVKMKVSAKDDGTGMVTFEHGGKKIQVDDGATVVIANVPTLCPAKGDAGHFAMYGQLLYGSGYVTTPKKSADPCGAVGAGVCQTWLCFAVVDVECSNSSYP